MKVLRSFIHSFFPSFFFLPSFLYDSWNNSVFISVSLFISSFNFFLFSVYLSFFLSSFLAFMACRPLEINRLFYQKVYLPLHYADWNHDYDFLYRYFRFSFPSSHRQFRLYRNSCFYFKTLNSIFPKKCDSILISTREGRRRRKAKYGGRWDRNRRPQLRSIWSN